MNIALIKCYALGDVVRSTSIISGIYNKHPEANITWVSSAEAIPLLIHHPGVSELRSLTDRPHELKEKHFSWVISLDEEEACATLASSLRADRLSGTYRDASGNITYTEDLSDWFGMGLLGVSAQVPLCKVNERKQGNKRSYLSILYECLGLDGPIARPSIHLSTEERLSAVKKLSDVLNFASRPTIGVFLGGGPTWERKRWTALQISHLVNHLSYEFDCSLVLIGGTNEIDQLVELTPEITSLRFGIVSLHSSRILASVIAELDVLITTDSLPLHLAVATNTPVVALFGPTSAAEIDLFGNGVKLETTLACRCCYLKSCSAKPDCRDSFELTSMVDAVKRLLQLHLEKSPPGVVDVFRNN